MGVVCQRHGAITGLCPCAIPVIRVASPYFAYCLYHIGRIAANTGDVVEHTNGFEVIGLVCEITRIVPIVRLGKHVPAHRHTTSSSAPIKSRFNIVTG